MLFHRRVEAYRSRLWITDQTIKYRGARRKSTRSVVVWIQLLFGSGSEPKAKPEWML